MTIEQFKHLVNDIAIACGLHPTSLGVDADEDGEIYLGKNIKLKVWRVENVFTFDKSKRPVWKPITSGNKIPSRVLDITTQKVRAVLVVEHKNLATQLSLVKGSLDDVIIIMVSHDSSALNQGRTDMYSRRLKASQRCPLESSSARCGAK